MLQNRLRFIKTLIYDLKRAYGQPADLYEIKYDSDLQSGVKTITFFNHVHIKRAIIAPTRELRSFIYDLAYISANKDFTTGGFFDPSDRFVIIDKKDVNGWDFELDQFITFGYKRYDLTLLQEYESDSVIICKAKALEGQKIIQAMNATSVIILTQSATGVIQ